MKRPPLGLVNDGSLADLVESIRDPLDNSNRQDASNLYKCL